jgi:hypothetical protein
MQYDKRLAFAETFSGSAQVLKDGFAQKGESAGAVNVAELAQSCEPPPALISHHCAPAAAGQTR